MSSGSKTYFEDLKEGQPLKCRTVEFTRESMIAFAAQFDPQPFHLDETAARDSIFKGLVASSLHTLSACTKVVVEAQGAVAILSGVGTRSKCSIRYGRETPLPSMRGGPNCTGPGRNRTAGSPPFYAKSPISLTSRL